MLTALYMKTKKTLTLAALSWLIVTGLVATQMLAANAQFADPLTPSGTPLPPPPGDGPNPLPIIPGDTGTALPPPSNRSDSTSGSIFPSGVGRDRTVVHIYKRGSSGALGTDRGNRMVQTIRPDQLTQEQIDKINGILGINMLSGEQTIDITAQDSQIEQIQEVIAAWPSFENNGGRKKITADPHKQPNDPWTSIRAKKNLYNFQVPPAGQEPKVERGDHPLPTVRTFARYLVIMGVMAGTIFMALAATSVMLGSRDGGARVIGSAVGLMLLLMAYTIWKVVQMNTFNANSDAPAISQNRPQEATVSDAYIKGSTVPPVPSTSRSSPGRFGVPLEPLGSARQN